MFGYHRKKIAITSAAAVALAVLCADANSQSQSETKLILSNVNLYSPDKDGFFNVNALVTLDSPADPNSNVTFNITLQHVKSVEDVREQIKPIVGQLADEAKRASANFEPHE